jgi:hypothetical protein
MDTRLGIIKNVRYIELNTLSKQRSRRAGVHIQKPNA